MAETHAANIGRRFNKLRVPVIIAICTGLVVCFLIKTDYLSLHSVTTSQLYGRSNISDGIYMDKSVHKFTSSRPCTFGLFRQVFARDHYYPKGGHWVNGTNNNTHYQPHACKFKYSNTPKAFMDRCFLKANISSVMTMGDSTAGRHFSALLKTSRASCRNVKSEHLLQNGFLPDRAYFEPHIPKEVMQFVKIKFRFCSGCAGREATCKTSASSLPIKFEHLPQTMILDDSIQITFPEYHNASKVLDSIWSITSQEFVFRYFLKDRYPQVFIIFLPFVHARQNMKLERVKMEIQYYKSLVEQYFPSTTKLIYFPAYSEFESARAKGYWKGRRYEGMLASEKIKKMNDILYEILEPDLLRDDGRVFSFLDVFEASLPHADWCTDGIHMKPIWYENVMTMFWETFCNSVMLDEF